jgi:SAM-dependent methyltransferase
LQRYFQFEPWHSRAPYACRPYKELVVDVVNRLRPGTVVEVGAGLGELLAHIDAPRRFGYDIDPGVVRAARFLHGRHITFIHGDATQVIRLPIDVLILVNWIHNLSPDELRALLEPLLPRTTHLLLDAIDADGPSSYRYKHTFDFLEGHAELLSISPAPDEPRSFHLFRVTLSGEVAPPT